MTISLPLRIETQPFSLFLTPLDESGELGLGGPPAGIDVHVVACAVNGAVLARLEAGAVRPRGAEGAIGRGGRLEDLAGVAGGEGLKRRVD